MKAIVTGVSGQDGYFQTRSLLNRGIAVIGLTSDLPHARKEFAEGVWVGLELRAFDYSAPGAFANILEDEQADLVFNYAAEATGRGMFDAPAEMHRLNGAFVLDILEAIRTSGRADQISFCQASSSEMFGHATEAPQSETTPFWPKSPYGAAKLYAHNMIRIYRDTYGVRAASAILYNHESTRRSVQFVTKKIANGAARIRAGLDDTLSLGVLDTARDWGYAPEYVEAMYLMATADRADDYVLATGRSNTIRRLCDICFGHLGLDYRNHVEISANDQRPIESTDLLGNPAKIARELGWRAKVEIEAIMIEMAEHELQKLGAATNEAATVGLSSYRPLWGQNAE